MTIEQALVLVDEVIFENTGKHLSDLQTTILREVWQGKKYLEIADLYGCTEGHAKDAGYILWKILSKAWGEKIAKNNFRTAIKKRLQLINYQINTAINSSLVEKKDERDFNFLGREEAISDLANLVNREKIIVIQGQGGIGKTTLAKKYLASQKFDFVLEFLMAKETQNITSVESLIEEWLKRDFQEEPGQEFGVTLARLKRHLEKHKIGILIDNLEPALDKNGQLITEQRNYLELFRILADSNLRGVTLMTSRDRFCEADLNLCHYRLSGLSLATWTKFFLFNQVPVIDFILQKMHHNYGGNAKAMRILCGVIKEDFAANINTYWQENQHDPLIERHLKNLVTSQFDRLAKLDFSAYLLLCRLGCYRYQDVPNISQAGLLALLWDVEKDRTRIIESLRNRSLIEFVKGNYWLHPVIKAEALSRLSPQEFKETNQKIALFYTETITTINSVPDGLTALEAYYHYWAVSDYTQAGKVILFSRSNQWGQHLTLGTTLYRLGLSQPLLKAITQIINWITEPKILSELNNILGDLYWISGKIKLAISCQESTIKTATNYLNQIANLTTDTQLNLYYWKMLRVDSLLSIGLYNIDLWELKQARIIFQQVIENAHNTQHHSWSEKASICLALVNSYLGEQELATKTTNKFIKLINQQQNHIYNTGRFAYFMQILGQTLINLQQYEQAQKILQKAIAFSQSSHYIQIKAKAITGLGVIQRQNNNFTQAYQYHQEAIQLLENINAKCDLAEAYYQFAIALKETDNILESKTYSAKAIQLFQQIKAPKQIEKITLMR